MPARIAAAAILIALLLAGSCPIFAFAQHPEAVRDLAACQKFSWSIQRERDWFSDKALVRRASGARLRKIDRAVELSLKPKNQVALFMPPKVESKSSSYSGEVTFFGVPKPGLYQVTLSEEASVDVFENGFRLKAIDSTREKNCLGVFESVRFELAPGDLVLVEITNATRDSIKVAFAQAT